jgi:hypothetical protein
MHPRNTGPGVACSTHPPPAPRAFSLSVFVSYLVMKLATVFINVDANCAMDFTSERPRLYQPLMERPPAAAETAPESFRRSASARRRAGRRSARVELLITVADEQTSAVVSRAFRCRRLTQMIAPLVSGWPRYTGTDSVTINADSDPVADRQRTAARPVDSALHLTRSRDYRRDSMQARRPPGEVTTGGRMSL